MFRQLDLLPDLPGLDQLDEAGVLDGQAHSGYPWSARRPRRTCDHGREAEGRRAALPRLARRDDRRDAALGLLDDLLEEIVGMPARTVAGLKLKATMTADVWLDPNLMASICADILAMEGNAHG